MQGNHIDLGRRDVASPIHRKQCVLFLLPPQRKLMMVKFTCDQIVI